MSFVSPYNNPKIMLLNDRGPMPFLLLEKLVYECEVSGEVYEVPANFRTDFASIPKALLLIPVVGQALFTRYFGNGVWQGAREAILHDFLRRGDNPPVTAAVAHRIFRSALYEAGYPPDLCESYYAAVVMANS